MKTIVISGANAPFWPLLSGLLHSINECLPTQNIAVGVLDFGLTEGQLDRLNRHGANVVQPDWDYPLAHFHSPPPSAFKVMTARPHLPRYFPGYDLYIWLDADCWVQDWQAIMLLSDATVQAKFAIIPEVHRSYETFLEDGSSFLEWFRGCYRTCFKADKLADKLGCYPILNSGVFGGMRDAPHWLGWQLQLGEILKRLDQPFFFAEQTALNYVIRHENLATAFLPAYCNWVCSRALPRWNTERQCFVEPTPPYSPLGLMHLAGVKSRTSPIFDETGMMHMKEIRYPLLPP